MWKTVKLGDVCEVLDSMRIPITKKDRKNGQYPYYGATDIVDWVDDFIFDEKLVLVGEDGAKWDAGEKTAFVVNGKIWVNNHAHVIRPNVNLVTHEWLSYYLTAIDLSPWVTGLTVPKLNQAQLRSIPIPLPPLAEQQRIVEKLDRAFAEIDAAITLGEEKLEKTNKALGKIIDIELSNLRKSHEYSKLGDMLIDVEYGTSTKCKSIGKYPVLRMGNMQNGRFYLDDLVYLDSHKEMQKYKVFKGDVFFNRTNSAVHVGKSAIYEYDDDCLFAGYLIKLKFDKNVIDGHFLNYYLNAPSTRNYGFSVMTSSVNQSNINGTKLKEYPIFKVDIDTQRNIRKKFEEIETLLIQAHKATSLSINQYRMLKSSMLKQALQPPQQ